MLGPNSSAERRAYDYIREQILSGATDGSIRQQEVADRLGISRIPVRDALKHLSAEGLVSVESNRRVLVAKMTVSEVREVFLMSSVVEGLAARVAAPNIPDSVLERLSLLAERMEHAETHALDWLRVHEEFHRLICAQSSMLRLQREAERHRAAAEPYLRYFFATHKVGELKGCKHRGLLDALKERNGETAEMALREHLEHGFAEISEAMS